MRPARSITEFLFGPALTAWSDQPNIPQTGAPTITSGRGRDSPPGRGLDSLGWFLALGLGGLTVLLTGLIWDASLHARNPELAHQ